MGSNRDIDIQLEAGLNLSASEQQLVADIKELQQRLEKSGRNNIKLKLEIDDSTLKSVENLDKKSKNLGTSLAKNLINQFHIVNKEAQKEIKDIAKSIYSLTSKELNTGKDNPLLIPQIEKLGQVVVENSNILRERMGIYDEFYAYFSKLGKIKISDTIKSDLGDDWKTLKQLYSSKFVTSKSGIEMDSIYQEMSDQFKDIFSGTSNPTEQFKEVTNAIKAYRADVATLEPVDPDKLVGFTDDVWDSVLLGISNMRTQMREQLPKVESDVKQTMQAVSESTKGIAQESTAMDLVEKSATEAAQSKDRFRLANEAVERSAEDTTDAINQEHRAMVDMDDLDSILANINMHGQQGTSVFQMFGTTLREAFYAYTAANLLQDAIHEVINSGREAVETVKELNDAAVSLQMATGKQYQEIKTMMDAYNVLGQELGALTTEISEGADSWLRQGHSIEDTNTLIRDSMMLSKVANLDSADATKYLTSAMMGYQQTVEEVLGISDRLVSIDLVSGTDAGGLAEAMSRTAEGAHIAGISMDRLLGMIAAVGEVTQKSMSSIGESYKTIFSRMRDIKDNKLQVVGDDGEIDDLSNVEIVLGSLGIKLRESNQEFRNFQDVLDEVASGWDNYSSVQQAAIAKAFSGVRQQENFLVLMENWDKVQEYTKVAESSMGATEEKFAFYLESLESKSKSLQASLENLASVTISDELYGSVLDTAKAMIDATAESGILKGALTGVATAGTLYTFQQLAGFVHDSAQEFSNLSEAINMVRVGNLGTDELQQLIDLTGGLSQSQTRLLLTTNNLTDAQKIAILMNQGLTRAQAEQQIQTWGVATAQNGLTRATITLGNTMRGLWATLMANPMILVTAAVTAASMAWSKYKQAQEEVRQATKESAEQAQTLSTEIQDLTSKYIELSNAVQTDSSAKSELLDIQSQLLEKLGLEKESLDDLISRYGSLSEAIRQASIDSLKEAQIDLIAGVDVARDDLLKAGKDNLLGTNNILSSSGDGAVKAYGVLADAGLMNRSSFGSGGGAFVLTGDESTTEGILENYERLDDALKALRDSNEFTMSELADNPVYKQIYDRWKELQNPVEKYQSAIDNLNANVAQQMTLGALQGLELPDGEEEFTKFRDNLVKSAQASGQFIGSVEDIEKSVDSYLKSIPEFAEYYGLQFDEMAKGAEQTADNIKKSFSKSEMISAINGLSEGFEELDKLYKSVSSDEAFDYALLDDDKFKETFSGLGDAYTSFVEQVSSSPDDINACQKAFNDLSSAWIKSTGILDGLSEENAELTTAMLKNMGISNAADLVTNKLKEITAETSAVNLEQQLLTQTGVALKDVTWAQVEAFANEQSASDIAKQALAELKLAQMDLTNNPINLDSSISEILTLAKAAKVGATQIAQLQRLDELQKKIQSGKHNATDFKEFERLSAQLSSTSTDWADVDLAFTPVDYSGGVKTTKASTAGSGATEKSHKADYIQVRIEALEKEHDLLNQIAEDESVSYRERISAVGDLIALDKERLAFNEKAAVAYQKIWEQAMQKITSEQARLIMNGGINVEEYSGTEAENIEAATDAWEDYQTQLEYNREAHEDYASELEREVKLREEIIKAQQEQISGELELVQSRIDLLTTQGGIVTEGMYRQQIALSQELAESYSDQIANLEEQLSMADRGSAEYYSLIASIRDCEQAIVDCKIEQENLNQSIKRLPIDRLDKYLQTLDQIRQDYDNFRNQQQTIGVPQGMEEYQQLIDLNAESIDKYIEKEKLLSDLLGETQYGSDRYDELANEIQDCQNSMSDLIAEQLEYNKAILNIPIQNLEGVNDNLSKYADVLAEQLDEYDSVHGAVIDLLDTEADKINEVIEATEKEYQTKIDSVQSTINLMKSANTEREKELAVEQALYELERVRGQKTVQAVRDGQLVWETDKGAERDAQSAYQNALYDKTIYELEKQIEAYETERDALLKGYQEQLDNLDSIKSIWEDIVNNITKATDILKANEVLGSGWQDTVLSGGTDNEQLAEYFKGLYEVTYNQKEAVSQQIHSNERIISTMNEFVERFTSGAITYEQALNGIKQLSTSIDSGYTAMEQLSDMMSLDGIANLSSIASSAEAKISQSVDLLEDYMSVVQTNSEMINQYTSTWEEMKQRIADQLEALKVAAEALEKLQQSQQSITSSKDYSYDDSDDDGGVWSGPNVNDDTYVVGGPGGTDKQAIADAIASGKDVVIDVHDEDEREMWEDYIDSLPRHHSGVSLGTVGNSSSRGKKDNLFQAAAENILKPAEKLVIAKEPEMLITPEQRDNLLKNIGYFNMYPTISKPNLDILSNRDVSKSIEVNMGNIVLEGVQDPDGFARAMKAQFGPLLRQEMSKVK